MDEILVDIYLLIKVGTSPPIIKQELDPWNPGEE